MNLTRKQRNRVTELKRLGYTAVFIDRDTGELLPGYHDWIIEAELDRRDLQTYYDDLGQAYNDSE